MSASAAYDPKATPMPVEETSSGSLDMMNNLATILQKGIDAAGADNTKNKEHQKKIADQAFISTFTGKKYVLQFPGTEYIMILREIRDDETGDSEYLVTMMDMSYNEGCSVKHTGTDVRFVVKRNLFPKMSFKFEDRNGKMNRVDVNFAAQCAVIGKVGGNYAGDGNIVGAPVPERC
jgi:hypothetical protein